MSKKIILSLLSAGLSFVLGLIICMVLTPVWWKLEPILKLELAGHSGPADWLLISFGVLFGVFGFFFLWKRN